MGKTAVVLAGGRGTRLAPYTLVFPKPLMPLGDIPVLEVVIRQLARDGFDRIVIAVGYLGALIEAYFGDGARFGVQLEYVWEETPLGTAGPLKNVAGLDSPFLVMNGDVLTTLDFGALLERHVESGAEMTVATYARTHRVDFGVVMADEDQRITGYLEKPESEYTVSMGVNVLDPSALDVVPADGYLDMPDLVLRLVAAGRQVQADAFDGYWLDIGRHDDFAKAQEEFEARRDDLLPAGNDR